MAGYCEDYSMSRNAERAYDDGLLPASKAAKCLKVSTAALEAHLTPQEQHHTSAKYNLTAFYDIGPYLALMANDAEALLRDYGEEEACDLAETYLAMRAMTRQVRQAAAVTYTDCTVEWLEWPYAPGCGGRWADRRPTERREEHCTVTVKGRTATVTLPSGIALFRKRLDTAGFSFRRYCGPQHGTLPWPCLGWVNQTV